jgi:hypothetical protein
MDDILLGLDEIEAERKRACEAWYPESGTIPWDYWWQRWLLRAQVRKVVEWIQKHNEAQCFIHKDGHFDARLVTGTVVLWPTEVQALRAAAEEVKPLPTIDEYIGSDPDFTGGMSTKEYIEDMRGTEPEEVGG